MSYFSKNRWYNRSFIRNAESWKNGQSKQDFPSKDKSLPNKSFYRFPYFRARDSFFPKGRRAIFDPETQTRKQRTTEVNKL